MNLKIMTATDGSLRQNKKPVLWLLAGIALSTGIALLLYWVGESSFHLSPSDPSYQYSPTKRKDSIGGGILIVLSEIVFFVGNAATVLTFLVRRLTNTEPDREE